MPTNPALTLKDPEIRKYFLSILQSNLSDDAKYERFIDFFELESQVKNELLNAYGTQLLTIDAKDTKKIGEIVSAASQTIGIWKPDEILKQTRDSIRRALQRLQRSQHRDGGWGYEVELSHPWTTAYAVLCLSAAKQVGDFDIEIEENLRSGLSWLKDRSIDWSVENIEVEGSRSVYDVSIVLRACYETEGAGFAASDQALHKLWESQNEDGGWDARLWPDSYPGPSRTYSEVGATSTALQALTIVKRHEQSTLPNFDAKLLKALRWCIQTQNDDGSWNNKSCTPQSIKIEGVPSITKTCDGIKGILAAKTSLPTLTADTSAASNAAIEKAIDWLLSQEESQYDRNGNIVGWGWRAEMIGDLRIANIENTWITLETLVRIKSESISLPLLTANAQWLIKQQHAPAPGEDSIEDGKWEPRGHTARIALSLIEFYKKIKASPLFEKAPST